MLQKCIPRAAQALRRQQQKCYVVPEQLSWTLSANRSRSYYNTSARCSTEQPVAPLRKQLKDEAKARRAATNATRGQHKPETVNSRILEWELTVGIEIHA